MAMPCSWRSSKAIGGRRCSMMLVWEARLLSNAYVQISVGTRLHFA